MIEYPILGFQPDLPQDLRGVLTGSEQVLPTDRGIGGGVTVAAAGSTGTFGTFPACGGAVLLNVAGTELIFQGTSTSLLELDDGTTLIDRSATTYDAGLGATWSFAQLGDVTLATYHGSAGAIQKFNKASDTDFSAVSGAPFAHIIVVCGFPNASFAMVFDWDSGSQQGAHDGIFWSALGDYTDWTPDIATQCGNIRLTDKGGKITAACPFRDGVVAFKKNAMYLGTYVGGSDMWDWTRISSEIGCLGKNAVCQVNDVLYFADAAGIWIYDGSYPRLAPGAIHKWWSDQVVTIDAIDDSDPSYYRLTWDAKRHLLWVGYGAGAFATAGEPNFIVYNARSQLWTQYGQIKIADGTQKVMELLSGEWADTKRLSQLFLSIDYTAANCLASDFTLGAHGNTYGMTTFRSIRPQFLAGDTDTDTSWVSGTLYYGPSLRNVQNASDSMSMAAPGRLDKMRQARFVQPKLSFEAGNGWECNKIAIDIAGGAQE